MGKRGPQKTNTKTLDARGSWRGSKVRHDEPPTTGKPKCPAWLSVQAKAHWKALLKRLGGLGIVGEADTDKLAVYCAMMEKFRAAYKEGDLKDMARLASHIDRIGSQFGLSPSARASMAIEMPKKEAEKRKFFREGGVA